VVGLGNPGPQYARTRHNAGFGVLDVLARRHGARWTRPCGVRGEMARCRLGTEALLLRPWTFMNASGDAVVVALRRLRLAAADVVLVYDDMDLPPGRLRIRPGGGSGGHRGVASVVAALGTEAFPRVRVGIGRPPEGADAADYVLSPLPPGEAAAWEAALARAADAVEFLCARGVEAAMQRFNGAPED
jgi:PTH1 family peptidyl-tRNA hydrolase